MLKARGRKLYAHLTLYTYTLWTLQVYLSITQLWPYNNFELNSNYTGGRKRRRRRRRRNLRLSGVHQVRELEIGAAHGARRAGAQPGVDAVDMEDVSAGWQHPHQLAFAHGAEADAAQRPWRVAVLAGPLVGDRGQGGYGGWPEPGDLGRRVAGDGRVEAAADATDVQGADDEDDASGHGDKGSSSDAHVGWLVRSACRGLHCAGSPSVVEHGRRWRVSSLSSHSLKLGLFCSQRRLSYQLAALIRLLMSRDYFIFINYMWYIYIYKMEFRILNFLLR